MSFYSDASVVMIPSGYKTSKVYCAVPTDGAADLSFSRSNDTATRVGPNGLIEKVRTNRVLYSELQTNGIYSGTNITSVTAVSNPLTGQNNAFKITSTTGNDPYFLQNVSGLSNGENTFSCWAWTDAGQSTEATLFFYNQTATEVYTKAITLTTTPTRYDHTVSFSNIGSIATVRIDLRQLGPSIDYLYTYGWQAESGVATDYIATTSAAVSVGPVANVPRLDYLNSSCPRLLLEGQRQNLALFSEQFDNAWWAKLSASALANDAISPDGYTNADKIRPNSGVTFSIPSGGIYTAGASSYIRSTGLTLTAASYTFSAFVKKGEYDHIQLRTGTSIDTTSNGSGVIVNLNNGTTTATSGYSIEDYGDGWYRISHTFTATAATWYLNFWFWNSTSVTANGTNGVYVYGAQLEAGAYATSYIPTLGAAVTRGVDAASKTGISSLIGQTEGTLFVEANVASGFDGNNLLITASDGSTSNMIFINRVSGRAEYYIAAGGVEQAAFAMPTVLSTGVHKLAIAYKANDFAFYVDGVLVHSDTSGSVPACDRVNVGSYVANALPYNDGIKQAILFPTRLSNSDLAALTA